MNVEAEQEMYPPCATPNRTRNATREPVEVAPRLFQDETKSQKQFSKRKKVEMATHRAKVMTPTRIARGRAVLKTPIRSATSPAPILAKNAVALMIASYIFSFPRQFTDSTIAEEGRCTYSVIGEEVILRNVSRIGDDIE